MPWARLLLAYLSLCGADDAGLVVSKRRKQRPKGALAVARDIETRVVEAGGNTAGVLVASLSWTSADDLDLHMVLPSGQEINYRNKKLGAGELDVDMCVQGRHSGKCADRPVENIVFDEEPLAGRYKIYVQNFNYHLNTLPENMQVARMQEGLKTSSEERQLRLTQDRPVVFDLLLKVHGVQKLFEGLCTPTGKTLTNSDVTVFEFDYDPSQEDIVSRFEGTPAPECQSYLERLALAAPKPKSSKATPALSNGGNGKVKERRAKEKESKRGKKDKKAKADARSAALAAVRQAPRELLAAKPISALRALLVDLQAACKGCAEKSELVDKLMEVAGHPEL